MRISAWCMGINVLSYADMVYLWFFSMIKPPTIRGYTCGISPRTYSYQKTVLYTQSQHCLCMLDPSQLGCPGLMGLNMKLGWRIVAQKWYKNQGSDLDFDPHLVGGDWNHGILWLSRNSWEYHHPNWRFVIFFRGVGWNHQPDILLIATFQHGPHWGSPIREDAHCTKTWRALAVRKSAGPVFWDGLKHSGEQTMVYGRYNKLVNDVHGGYSLYSGL